MEYPAGQEKVDFGIELQRVRRVAQLKPHHRARHRARRGDQESRRHEHRHDCDDLLFRADHHAIRLLLRRQQACDRNGADHNYGYEPFYEVDRIPYHYRFLEVKVKSRSAGIGTRTGPRPLVRIAAVPVFPPGRSR